MNSEPDGLVDRVEAAMDLFGRRLEVGQWHSDRAVGPELAVFKHSAPGQTPSYIHVEYYCAGETDEDGYTWDTDTYQICISRGDGTTEYETATSRRNAARIVAREMRHINDTSPEVSANA